MTFKSRADLKSKRRPRRRCRREIHAGAELLIARGASACPWDAVVPLRIGAVRPTRIVRVLTGRESGSMPAIIRWRPAARTPEIPSPPHKPDPFSQQPRLSRRQGLPIRSSRGSPPCRSFGGLDVQRHARKGFTTGLDPDGPVPPHGAARLLRDPGARTYRIGRWRSTHLPAPQFRFLFGLSDSTRKA